MADMDGFAKTFCQTYYSAFDTNRATLGSLYAPDAQMTFEGTKSVGAEAILQKLVSLSFQRVQHAITTLDCQMTQSGLLVFVVGQLKTDDDAPHSFSQSFHIVELGQGQYFISNDIFRLSLHHS